MSTLEAPSPGPVVFHDHPASAHTRFWQRVDDLSEWLGDRINPIVVKEARQSLKSRQFLVTFGLLLVCGAIWTALGVATNMPQILYEPAGPDLAMGYYCILCVPMLLVVPFVAYRSLAAEREDGTFELLSITSLQARDIVLGKLASAILQMMVFYSALAPCLAFTYLLKGLDIITILLFLVTLFEASVLLSSISLAMGTITRARHWQVLVSVLLVGGLCLNLFWWLAGSYELFSSALQNPPYDQSQFWEFMLGALSVGGSFIPFFVLVAAGQISFITDNRSTPVRWVAFGQHVLWFGWMLLLLLNLPDIITGGAHFVYAASVTGMIVYCWIIGAFMVGEKAEMSPRVRRQLPQTLLGRMFLTWFNPGSGTGYVFILTNVLAFVVLLGIAYEVRYYWGSATAGAGVGSTEKIWMFGLTATAYLATFLGLGRVITLFVNRRTPNTAWFSFLLQIVLVAFGTLLPLVFQFSISTIYNDEYTWLQLSNPFWTLVEILQDDYVAHSVAGLVMVAGAFMALAHFAHASVEVYQTRVFTPQRVRDEDAAQLAARTPVRKKNPWDEPDPDSGKRLPGPFMSDHPVTFNQAESPPADIAPSDHGKSTNSD